MTNMIVTAMLLLGGGAVVNGLTGMNISVVAFLIPVGVMIYTLVGGLKVYVRRGLFAYHYNFHYNPNLRVCCLLYKSSDRGSTGNV